MSYAIIGLGTRQFTTPTDVRKPPVETYDNIVGNFGSDVVSYWKFANTGTDERGVQNATISGSPELNVPTIVDLDRLAEGASSEGVCIAWPGTVGEYAQASHNSAHKTLSGTVVVTFQCDRLDAKSVLVCADSTGAIGGMSVELNANGSPRAFLRGASGTPTLLVGAAGDVQLQRAYTQIFKWGPGGLSLSLWNDVGGLIRRISDPLTDGLAGTSPIRFGAWHTDIAHHDGPYGRVIWLNRRISDSEEAILARARTIARVVEEPAPPPATTFVCLSRTTGNLNTTNANLGVLPPGSSSRFCEGGNARNDLRGTVFMADHISGQNWSNLFFIRINVASNGGCASGGAFRSDITKTQNWNAIYPTNHAGHYLVDANSTTITNWLYEGGRIHACWDAFRVHPRNGGTLNGVTFRGFAVTLCRDDGIENDTMQDNIRIEDSLFDGCFTVWSCSNSGFPSGNAKTNYLHNSLVRLEGYTANGASNVHLQFFKIWTNPSPKFDLRNNYFCLDKSTYPPIGGGDGDPFYQIYRDGQNKIAASVNNILLWRNSTPYPHPIPSGFTLVQGSEATQEWNLQRTNWWKAHPLVHRFSDIDPPV